MSAVRDMPLEPVGHQQLSSLASATALTVPSRAKYAAIQCTGQPVRYLDSGTNPTASLGNRILTTSDGLWYTGKLSKLKFIEETASAVLNVLYYA